MNARGWVSLLILGALATAPTITLAHTVGENAGTTVSADDDHDLARRLKDAGEIVPLETLIAQARTTYPEGRVIETELQRRGGRWVYEIELLDRGVVHQLRYDARTGQLLSTRDK